MSIAPRLAELKGKPVTVDNESGEVVKDDKKAPKLTYAKIAAKLNKATDQDNLDAAADLIQYCTCGADQVEDLNKLYKTRRDEFKSKE